MDFRPATEMMLARELSMDIIGHIKNCDFGLAKSAAEKLRDQLEKITNTRKIIVYGKDDEQLYEFKGVIGEDFKSDSEVYKQAQGILEKYNGMSGYEPGRYFKIITAFGDVFKGRFEE